MVYNGSINKDCNLIARNGDKKMKTKEEMEQIEVAIICLMNYCKKTDPKEIDRVINGFNLSEEETKQIKANVLISK